jgi:hypothetical protein
MQREPIYDRLTFSKDSAVTILPRLNIQITPIGLIWVSRYFTLQESHKDCNATEFVVSSMLRYNTPSEWLPFLYPIKPSGNYVYPAQRPTQVGTGNGDHEVPELPSVWGYSWATLSPVI